jgi:hypothetical protein
MTYRRIAYVLVASLLLIPAGMASAQETYKLTGAWYMNRGPLVDIPLNGGGVGCPLFGANSNGGANPAITNNGFPDGAHTPSGEFTQFIPDVAGQPRAGCVGILNQPTTPTTFNPNVGAAPINGGIPALTGARVVMGSGSPRSFTVQPDGFHQKVGKQVAAVAVAPTVVQLGSTYTPLGPADRGTLGPANDRNFRASAWTAQAGRMAANFTWCPPGTAASHAPSCTNPNNAASPYNGLIRYRAGTNAFGGTMAMMLSGQSTVTVKLDANPTGQISNQVAAAPIGGTNLQAPGKGYASVDIDLLAGGERHPTHMINFPCTNALPAEPFGCSQITASGPLTGTGAGDTNINWGMPWTTGTVTVHWQGTRTETLTAMGSDSRNAAGAGNITLVAGGLSHRFVAAQHFAALDVVNLTIAPLAPTLSPTGIGVLGGLIVISAGYVLRRRLS